jgi:hypothetical protein
MRHGVLNQKKVEWGTVLKGFVTGVHRCRQNGELRFGHPGGRGMGKMEGKEREESKAYK